MVSRLYNFVMPNALTHFINFWITCIWFSTRMEDFTIISFLTQFFFFFVLGHMFSVNQLQFWIEKIQYLNFTEICTIIRRIWLHHLNLFLYFIMCYKKIWIGKTTFLRFCSSFTLEHNFSLVHLKYSPKYLTVKSSNSLSVKIFK